MSNLLSLNRPAAAGANALIQASTDAAHAAAVTRLFGTLDDASLVQPILEYLRRTPDGIRALAERPRLGVVDFKRLRGLPHGSFGRAFAEHMERQKGRAQLQQHPATTDAEYVIAHLLECHEVHHVVTGFGTDATGELALQAFTLAQIPSPLAPMFIAASMIEMVTECGLSQRDARLKAVSAGWRMGIRAAPLFGQAWAEMWGERLDDVRGALSIMPMREMK